MAVTGTLTVREIVQDALEEIEVVTLGQAPDASESERGRKVLERMLKAWQMQGHPLFVVALQSLTLTTAASYTLSPVRPVRILNANLKTGGLETPMVRMTRLEYEELPDKDATGTPSQFYYDRQRESALFYVWPVLSAADDETVEITYEREIEDIASLSDTIDVPGEWYDAVVLGLADRLQGGFGNNNQLLTMRASQALRSALGPHAEESVFIEVDYG